MRKYILIFFVLIAATGVNAQRNRIELSLGDYNLFYRSEVKGGYRDYVRLIGIGYNRKIRDKLDIGVRYLQPNFYIPSAGSLGIRPLSHHVLIDGYDDIGKLMTRQDYHYWDLGISYECFRVKNHSLNIRQHLSLAHGKDEYITDIIAWEYPNEFHIIYLFTEYRNAHYWGGVSGIDYNYHLWNDKVNIGAEFSARYYLNHFPFQINYGLRIGYNF